MRRERCRQSEKKLLDLGKLGEAVLGKVKVTQKKTGKKLRTGQKLEEMTQKARAVLTGAYRAKKSVTIAARTCNLLLRREIIA